MCGTRDIMDDAGNVVKSGNDPSQSKDGDVPLGVSLRDNMMKKKVINDDGARYPESMKGDDTGGSVPPSAIRAFFEDEENRKVLRGMGSAAVRKPASNQYTFQRGAPFGVPRSCSLREYCR